MAAINGLATNCRCGRVEEGITDRRGFLRKAGAGFGMLALADLLGRDRLLAEPVEPAGPMAPRPPHHAARAKSVIWLFNESLGSSAAVGRLSTHQHRREGARIAPSQTGGAGVAQPIPDRRTPPTVGSCPLAIARPY